MKKISEFGAALVIFIALSGQSTKANILSNGSFELASQNVSLPTGIGSALLPGNTDIAGWTVIGGHQGGSLAWISNINPYPLQTPFGQYFLDLTGYDDNPAYFGVTQQIFTTPGDRYLLTFDVGVGNFVSSYSGPVGVTVVAGPLSQTISNLFPPGVGSAWQQVDLQFTANTFSTTVSIVGFQGDAYIGLDNMTIERIIPTVSEPRSILLFLFCTLILGGIILSNNWEDAEKRKGRISLNTTLRSVRI